MTRLGDASDGDSALQAAVHDHSDLVVDVNMPGIDGFEVCRRVKGVHLHSRHDVGRILRESGVPTLELPAFLSRIPAFASP